MLLEGNRKPLDPEPMIMPSETECYQQGRLSRSFRTLHLAGTYQDRAVGRHPGSRKRQLGNGGAQLPGDSAQPRLADRTFVGRLSRAVRTARESRPTVFGPAVSVGRKRLLR